MSESHWVVKNVGVPLGSKKISNLCYTDDTGLLVTTDESMLELLRHVKWLRGIRKFTRLKSCIMTVEKQRALLRRIQKNNKTWPISKLAFSREATRKRIGMNKNPLFGFKKIWNDHFTKETQKVLFQFWFFLLPVMHLNRTRHAANEPLRWLTIWRCLRFYGW